MESNHIQYAKQALKGGKPKEEIYRDLLARGLKIEEIEDCLAAATSNEDAKEEAQNHDL